MFVVLFELCVVEECLLLNDMILNVTLIKDQVHFHSKVSDFLCFSYDH